MINILDNVKNITMIITFAFMIFLYYNYKKATNEVEYLKSENARLVEINEEAKATLEKLNKDIQKNNQTVTKNIKKKNTISKKQIETVKEIEQLSEVKDDAEYEKLINEKYKEIMKCVGYC